MTKEERVLFPMIRELATSSGVPAFHCGSLRNPIAVMLSEHDAVGDLLARLRRLTDGYTAPADGSRRTSDASPRWRNWKPTRICTSTRRTTCCFRWSSSWKPSAGSGDLMGARRSRATKAANRRAGAICSRMSATTSPIATTSKCWSATSTGTQRWTTSLGPVFEAARVNWNAHIATLIDFWAWQLLGEPGYDGHPLRAHEPIHARTPFAHSFYERWVDLFCGTVDASFQGRSPRSPKGGGARWRQRWNACYRACRPAVSAPSNRCGGASGPRDPTVTSSLTPVPRARRSLSVHRRRAPPFRHPAGIARIAPSARMLSHGGGEFVRRRTLRDLDPDPVVHHTYSVVGLVPTDGHDHDRHAGRQRSGTVPWPPWVITRSTWGSTGPVRGRLDDMTLVGTADNGRERMPGPVVTRAWQSTRPSASTSRNGSSARSRWSIATPWTSGPGMRSRPLSAVPT